MEPAGRSEPASSLEEPLPKRCRSRQDERDNEEFSDADSAEDGLAALAAAAQPPEGDAGAWARERVLTSEHLLTAVFAHLSLEELCRCAMVRRRWREVTSNPEFWQTINLKGRTVQVSKVRQLLMQHSGVRVLNARGVAFASGDMALLLPRLTRLESLELDKGGYDRGDLEALAAHVPALTRLVLAGGLVGPHLPEWGTLAHPRLQALELAAGRAVRLRIHTPQLTHLSLRDFSAGALQLQEANSLQALGVVDCSKLTDSALRGLLCLDGPGAAVLPALTSLSFSAVPCLTDETLRLAGQRHPALASLALASCGALTGAHLGQHGAFAVLRCLAIECCDTITGPALSESLRELQSLEELRLTGCAQVTTLRLQSPQLAALQLCGVRALQELDVCCARLADVTIRPLSPGLAACHALKRIQLASHAVERLQWSAFPALETVRLQCPNLRELDLSECHALRDSVFESLGPGQGPAGYPGDALQPGCPRLQVLKLGDCESLRHAALASPSLECLQLSQCRWLETVQLECPMLTQLALEECSQLEAASLRSARMARMSLGTCPRLASIAVHCEGMRQLDLRGCNRLATLELACPQLQAVDATFCSSLGDAAIESLARCDRLQELVLAVCNSVTSQGLAALSRLSQLRRLDLSYTPLEDPTPIYAACAQLTALTLSNNYMLRAEALLPLLAGPGRGGGKAGELPPLPPLLPSLADLDVSYCPMPAPVLARLVTSAARLGSLSVNGCRGGITDALWPLLHRRADEAAAGAAPGDAGGLALAPGWCSGAAIAEPPAGPDSQDDCGVTAAAAVPRRAPPGLRSLSMVGSKEVHAFCLGLAPAEETLAHGLLARRGGAEVAAEGGRQYALVATPLEGLHELRLSLSSRLRSLALGLPQLADLQLNNCGELGQLVLHCPRLQRLAMQACKAMRPPALLELVARCPQLRELDLQYCPQATPEVVAALHAACPSLQAVLVTAPHAATPP